MKPAIRFFRITLMPLVAVWLYACNPVLALYAHNVQEVIAGQLLIPLAFILTLASAVFIIWRLFLGKNLYAGPATVLFLLLFWNYTALYNLLSARTGLEHWHLWPLLVVICLHLVYLVTRIREENTLVNVNTVLFVPVLILVLMNLSTIVPAEIGKNRAPVIASETETPAPGPSGNDPDIFLIVLDEYASLKTMREEWNYDNSPFVESLRKKGFYVAENSEARYNQTIWSISSLLNLDYVTGPIVRSTFVNFATDADVVKGDSSNRFLQKIDFNDIMQRLNTNHLTAFLKARGYRIVILEGISQFQSSFKIRNADQVFSYQDVNRNVQENIFSDAFYLELFKKSMIMPFDLFFKLIQTFSINYAGTRQVISFLEKDVDTIPGPKFVYAHIMCPHGPFVFSRNGKAIEPLSAESQRIDGVVPQKNTLNDAYLDQYIFISLEIEKVVDARLNRSRTHEPVIIIQSDHGPRPFEVFLKNRMNSFRVLNAVRFPGCSYPDLYDSIAPVNVIRVMMNRYFNGNYQMVKDH